MPLKLGQIIWKKQNKNISSNNATVCTTSWNVDDVRRSNTLCANIQDTQKELAIEDKQHPQEILNM